MSHTTVIEGIESKYKALLPYLNEKTRRLWAAVEADALGYRGVSQVSQATGLSRTTIYAGLRMARQLGRALPNFW